MLLVTPAFQFIVSRVKTDYQEEVEALKRTQQLQKVETLEISVLFPFKVAPSSFMTAHADDASFSNLHALT